MQQTFRNLAEGNNQVETPYVPTGLVRLNQPQGCSISIDTYPQSHNKDLEKDPVHNLRQFIGQDPILPCFAYRTARRAIRSVCCCCPGHERRRPRPAYVRQRRGRPVQRNRVRRGPPLL